MVETSILKRKFEFMMCTLPCLNSSNFGINFPGKGRRWLIYIIGVVEALLFGGCIFGWGQLVYILKNEGIFSNLCHNSTDIDDGLDHVNETQGCVEQDKAFALAYTIACVAYSSPAVLIGMTIHYAGLGVSRTISSLFTVSGFVSLAYTTKENTNLLFVSVVFLALGGNILRMSGLQFCNLFPRYRSTALAIISGCFAASAGLFMFFQFGQEAGFSLWSMSLCMAGVAFLSIPATLIVPRHEIPNYTADISETVDLAPATSLSESIFSVSAFTHLFWLFINLCAVKFFAMFFNSWITKISRNGAEAGHYSMFYGVSSFLCPLISPMPGLVTDYFSRKALAENQMENRLKKELRSPLVPLTLIIIVSLGMLGCLFFKTPVAVYCSLLSLILLRGSIIATGNSFLRIRFPAEHFNRLLGIHGTTVAIFTSLVYPFFVWTQSDFKWAMNTLLIINALTAIHPLHLLSVKYFHKISTELLRKYHLEKMPLNE